jgi:ATPase subunit of ABC transporter with duplicated ATPase domains
VKLGASFTWATSRSRRSTCSIPTSPSKNSCSTISAGADRRLRSLAGAFQFSGDDTDKKIRALSGGEKTRLVLARMLLNPPNFLVLDEPTNHLDLATKEMLLDSLKAFDGTMLFVSHDREFLRGLSNRVLELGGESGVDAQPTPIRSYVDYVERTGHEAPGVHR